METVTRLLGAETAGWMALLDANCEEFVSWGSARLATRKLRVRLVREL